MSFFKIDYDHKYFIIYHFNMEEALSILEKNLSQIRIPTESSLVYKDECAYSYHCQVSLFFIIFIIFLITFLGI